MNDCEKIYIKRVQFLRDNIAPDDIYEFAEQALSGSEIILRNCNIDYEDEDSLFNLVAKNLISLRKLCNEDYKGGLRIRTPWDDN